MSKTMLDASRGPSKKQIRISKISVSIVLARKLKNSRHIQGYQRAGACKGRIIRKKTSEKGNKI